MLWVPIKYTCFVFQGSESDHLQRLRKLYQNQNTVRKKINLIYEVIYTGANKLSNHVSKILISPLPTKIIFKRK
jgi:hypothetical protein